jgi:hypothetical protein
VPLLAVHTEIQDKDGVARRYECVPFEFDESLNLGLEIADVIGGPLGKALASMLMGGSVDLDAEIPADSIAAHVMELPANLLKAGGADFLARIVKNCKRTIQVDGRAKLQSLSDPAARTDAFGGGNLMEYIRVVRWVFEVNFGPFLTEAWQAFSEKLSGFADVDPAAILKKKSTGGD